MLTVNACIWYDQISAGFDKLQAMAIAHPAQLVSFFIALFFFHASEFLLALFFHGSSKVSSSSLLFSKHYLFAMFCGLLEYGIEGIYVPELKTKVQVSYIGLALIIVGEVVRKAAILTAKHNFTHDIKMYHREDHELVTHGIYRFVRHPSYLGFFLWSIGTQVLLVNPLCMVGYSIVTWRYFSQRILYPEQFLLFILNAIVKGCMHVHSCEEQGKHSCHPNLDYMEEFRFLFISFEFTYLAKYRFEEYFLRQFFGRQYVEYSKRVPSGIPFVR